MPIRDKVYDKLRSMGLTDSKEDFFSYYDSDENVRKQVYKDLKADGLTDSEEEFYEYMKPQTQPEEDDLFEENQRLFAEGKPTKKVTTQSMIDAHPELGLQSEPQLSKTDQYILDNKPEIFGGKKPTLVDIPLGDTDELSNERLGKRLEIAQSNQKERTKSRLQSISDEISTAMGDLQERVEVSEIDKLRPANMQYMPTNPVNKELMPEYSALRKARRLVEESENIIEEASKKGNTNFVAGLARGFWDNLNAEDYTFGADDAEQSAYLLRALDKAEKGEELTKAEETLLDAAAINMATQAFYAQDLGKGYKAGSVTAESIPFMMEMAINPISSFGKASAKQLLNYGLKRFVGNAVKGLAKGAAAGAGMAATTGIGRVAEGTTDRLAENYNYGVGLDGQLYVEKVRDMGIGEAAVRSFASTAIENQSEMIFNAFRGAGQLMKGLDKYIPGGVNTFFDAVKNSKVGQIWKGIKNSPLRKDFMEATNIGGIGEEYLEEVYNNLANFAIGEMEWKDVVSLDNNIDTFLGLAPTQAIFMMLGLGNMGAIRYQTKRDIENLRASMNEQQQRQLDELLSMGKVASNLEVRDLIHNTVVDQSLTSEQKRASIEAAYNIAMSNAAEQIAEAETQDRVETENAAIDAMTDPSTGKYAELTRKMPDGVGGTVEQQGYIVGWIGNAPVFVPEGMENTVENRVVLQPSEWDSEAVQEMDNAEVKALNEEMIREEAANQAEMESKYAPEVLNAQMVQGQPIDTPSEQIIPISPMPEGNGWIVEVYAKDTNNKVAAKPEVKEMTTDEFRDMLQAQYEAEQAAAEQLQEQVEEAVEEVPVAEQPTIATEEAVQPVVEEAKPQASVIPTKEDGSIDFVSYGKEGSFQELGKVYGEKIPHKVEVTAKALAEDMAKAQAALDKAQEAVDNAPIGREAKAKAALDKAQQEFDAVKREADFWNEMDADIKAAQAEREAILNQKIEAMGEEPMTADEFVAQQLSNGNIALTVDSYKKETGYGEAERKKFPKMFRKAENGGMTIERAGERLMEIASEEGLPFFDQNDPNAGRDALLNVLGSVQSWGDVTGYIRSNRERQAERESEGLRDEMEDAAIEAHYDSLEDYVLQREWAEVDIPFEGVDINEKMAIFAEAAAEYENYLNQQENGQGTTEENAEGSDDVLSEEQSDNTGRTEEQQEPERTDEGFADEGEAAHAVEQEIGQKQDETILEYAERIDKEEQRRRPLRERANEWGTKLGVKVNIIENINDVINKAARKAILNGERVTGWYEESTGEVCLFMPYITSEKGIDATYIHEVVAHKGIRGLLGDKFGEFCDNVWDMMSNADRAKFMSYPGVSHLKGKEKERAAADEYIAHLAENIDVSGSVWNKFTELLRKFLKAIGIEPKMSDAEIANTIKQSYQRLIEGGTENVGGEGTRFNAKRISDRRQEMNRVNNTVDQALSLVYGKDIKEIRKERQEQEQKRKEDAEEIYQSVLSGDFNDVTLQKINDYIDDATPLHPYGKRISQRLPQKLERDLHEGARTNAVDALFSRICESAVSASRRASEAGRREIEERKKEALKGWAIATNNWHTDLSDFADEADFIRQGTDSKVYLSKDGKHVIKVSFGKPEGKRFRPDIDTTALFNNVFRNTAYEILGYGEFDGKFARILKQPFVDFADKTALNAEEREEYMRTLGFEPINESKTAFSNGSIVAADLQKSNILKDAAGNISVIDADMKLHTKDVGGNYTYPPVEADLPENTRFRTVTDKNGNKSLVGLHNISEEKLRKAIKQGGLANPSMAVIDLEKQSHVDYGDITLIAPAELIDKKSGRNIGTYMADAYTPIYPTVVKKMSDKGAKEFTKALESVDETFRSKVRTYFNSYLDAGTMYDALYYWYLSDTGKNPPTLKALLPEGFTIEEIDKVKSVKPDAYGFYDLSNDEKQEVVRLYADRFYGGMEGYKKYLDEYVSKLENSDKSEAKLAMVRRRIESNLNAIKEYGYEYDRIASYYSRVLTLAERQSKPSEMETFRNAFNEVKKSGLEEDFGNWLLNKESELGVEEMLFVGYDNQGRAKYKPNTLENASKLMKKEGRAGATGLGGFNYFVAILTPVAKDTKQINKKKQNLSTQEEYDEFAKKWGEHYHDLALRLQSGADKWADYGYHRLHEIAPMANPKEYVKKEYGIELSDKFIKDLNDVKNAIKNDFPARYFETKFERPVYLNEFAAAVVPQGTSEDVVNALTDAGLPVEEYEKDNNEARMAAVDKVSSETDGVRFRVTFSQEEQSIIKKAKTDGTYMKAPNGNPTNLSEKQWAQVRTNAFKKWFGDWENDPANASKVVDENGEPLVMIHNSTTSEITEFRPNVGNAIFFADKIAQNYVSGFERGENNYEVFLNIRNPHTESYEAAFIDESDGIDGVFVTAKVDEGIGHAAIVRNPNQIKSATGNVGTFDEGNNDIRFRFIGERGARNLDQAEEATTRLDNLAVAREMEAAEKDAKTIKMATGWERGADGKWRYEVKDHFDVDAMEKFIRGAFGKVFGSKVPLERILKDEETLLTEYPQLKKVSVRFQRLGDVWGVYYPETNEIAINYNLLRGEKEIQDRLERQKELVEQWRKPEESKKIMDMIKVLELNPEEELKKAEEKLVGLEGEMEFFKNQLRENLQTTIIHEIQHAIQHIEGFEKGASVKDKDPNKVAKQKENLAFMQKQLESHKSERDELLKKKDELNEKMSAWYDSHEDASDEDVSNDKDMQVWNLQYDEIEAELENADKKVAWDEKWIETINNAKTELGEEGYNKVAGEVEARNAARRSLAMNPDEMREYLASETEDVSREDQIFLNGAINRGASEMRFRIEFQEAKEAVEDFTSKYNSKPVNIIDSEMADAELEEIIPGELADNIRKGIATGINGGYDYIGDKIYIFADNVSPEDIEDALFHENHHAQFLNDKHIINEFYGNSIDKFPKNKSQIRKEGYSEELLPEELFVRILADAETKGDFHRLEKYLSKETYNELINLLKENGYDIEKETDARRGRGRSRIASTRSEKGEIPLQSVAEESERRESEIRASGRMDRSGRDGSSGRNGADTGRVAQESETYVGTYSVDKNGRERAREIRQLFDQVADNGLRGVVGDDIYDRSMLDMYRSLPMEAREKVAMDALSNHDADMGKAIDKFVSESYGTSSWDIIVGAIRNMLRKKGFDIRFSDNDIRYLVWRNRQRLNRSSIIDVAEDIDTRFRIYGGNSGYVGYSMSKRAAEAREDGRYPKTDFKKEYGVTENSFNILVEAGIIDDSEWHHTSKFGNKTTFYSWYEEHYFDIYTSRKKEIDKRSREIQSMKPKMADFELSQEGMNAFTDKDREYWEAKKSYANQLWNEFNEEDGGSPTDGGEDNGGDDNEGVRFRVITDEKLIDELESSEKRLGYRNVVLNEDGTLGSPMASKLGKTGGDKKKTSGFEIGKWEQAEENPDLVDENGKIDLIKPDGKQVKKVDYNPYIHNRLNCVNRQFKQAWERPDLVYVETEIPLVDLESGYHAPKAAKSVGEHKWNGGNLILSRYDKPVRIVEWEEVADDWEKAFKKSGVHFDIVPPALLPILASRDVKILPPHKGMGEECNKAYQKFIDNTPDGGGTRYRLIEEVNDDYNKKLEGLNESNADKVQFNLGNPSDILLSAGVEDKPMKLYGNKVIKKMKKHGFSLDELRDLPKAVANPIAVFDNLGRRGNRSVLTELRTDKGNFLVTLDLGKGGEDIDFNIVSSVFGKGEDNIVDWIERGLATYINKEKALNYLHHSALYAEALSSSRLDSATKIVESFENPNIEEENVSQDNKNSRFRVSNKLNIRDEYEALTKKGKFQAREALQDAMLSLRRVQEMIEKATGKKLRDFENAWMHENRLSSVVQAEIHEMERKFYKPMMNAVSKLAKAMGESESYAVADYLILKHGIERNREMAVRKALTDSEGKIDRAKLDQWYQGKEVIRNDASLDTWRKKQEAMDNAALNYGADMSVDYSGLTSMFDTDDLADSTDRAYKEVETLETNYPTETKALGDAVKAMTQSSLDKAFESGLMDRKVYDELSKDMYDYYIPLRGFEETTSDEVYAYMDNDRGAFNAPLVRAKGRTSKSDNPLAYMKSIAESGIMQGNRNKMKQTFLNMVINNPSDLVSVKEGVWAMFNPTTGEWEAVSAPPIPNNATPADIENIMENWEAQMERNAQSDPNVKKVREADDVPYRVVGNRINQHQIIVKRLGKSYTLTINGNPRLAMALNGQTNPNNTSNDGKVAAYVSGKIDAVNRNLAAWYTTRNPDFVASNFMRDTFYTNTIVRAKEGNTYANKFHKQYARLLMPNTMLGLFNKYENGTLDPSKPIERDFLEFMMNGGETGYSNLKDLEQIKKQIEKEVKGSRWQKVEDVLEKLDILNRAVENIARFAAYRTSRQMGRSIAKSVFDAKEISVNFNKKGSGGTFFGMTGQTKMGNLAAMLGAGGRAMYVFFNAAIQGTTNLLHAAKVNPVGTSAGLTAMFIMGAIVPYLLGGDDENDYYDLPEHVRRNHLIIPGAGDAWISIPLPIEYRIMYGMGELLTSWRTGHERGENIARKMLSLSGQALPLNFLEEGLDAFVPSAISPLWQSYNNRSWTGLPIYKENEFNKHDPEYTKAYSNTDRSLVKFTKTLYDWTFDEENQKEGVDLNPAIIETIARGYFGGMFTTWNNLAKTLSTIQGEREFDWRNIPIANRVFKSGDVRTKEKRITNEYFENIEKYEFMQARERRLKKVINGEAVPDDDKREADEEYKIMKGSTVYDKYISGKESFKAKKKEIDKVYRKRKEKDSEELERKYYKLLDEANKMVR